MAKRNRGKPSATWEMSVEHVQSAAEQESNFFIHTKQIPTKPSKSAKIAVINRVINIQGVDTYQMVPDTKMNIASINTIKKIVQVTSNGFSCGGQKLKKYLKSHMF
ncbi:hypothetical protein [Bacillus sp. FJAT-29814]|uniref:hypothetical protein n=1 Tax=Bacillus sp. FJAT-29814 TaxID=1729688 RepID=UPI000830FC60|nr:hypothetical protein [Bacillus sp. FJAT-29814]